MYLKSKLGMTESSDIELQASNEVTCDGSDGSGDQLTDQNLNHAQIRWLNIGEKLGILLLRVKSWLSV